MKKKILTRKEVEAYHLALGFIFDDFYASATSCYSPFFLNPKSLDRFSSVLLLSSVAHGFSCRLRRGPLQFTACLRAAVSNVIHHRGRHHLWNESTKRAVCASTCRMACLLRNRTKLCLHGTMKYSVFRESMTRLFLSSVIIRLEYNQFDTYTDSNDN